MNKIILYKLINKVCLLSNLCNFTLFCEFVIISKILMGFDILTFMCCGKVKMYTTTSPTSEGSNNCMPEETIPLLISVLVIPGLIL